MNPQEIKNKADELMTFFGDYPLSNAWKKQCAKFACEEIIKEIFDNYDSLHASDRLEFWQSIKQFIENNY